VREPKPNTLSPHVRVQSKPHTPPKQFVDAQTDGSNHVRIVDGGSSLRIDASCHVTKKNGVIRHHGTHQRGWDDPIDGENQ
jgi:hypothetical protein